MRSVCEERVCVCVRVCVRVCVCVSALGRVGAWACGWVCVWSRCPRAHVGVGGMSCFWDGLRSKVDALRKFTSPDVRAALQAINVRTTSITINGEKLTDAELDLNFEWVRDDVHPWNGGHDTPSGDPYLALVAELFCTNIIFNFAGNVQRFEHPRATISLSFTCSTTHFS